jgi:hypothetical protein
MIAVSLGELVDKITILEIKQRMLTNPQARANVNRELVLLTETFAQQSVTAEILNLKDNLATVNLDLWHIENFKRTCEAQGTFESDFVSAARQVYIKNDLRARIKKEINLKGHSLIVEEKSY